MILFEEIRKHIQLILFDVFMKYLIISFYEFMLFVFIFIKFFMIIKIYMLCFLHFINNCISKLLWYKFIFLLPILLEIFIIHKRLFRFIFTIRLNSILFIFLLLLIFFIFNIFRWIILLMSLSLLIKEILYCFNTSFSTNKLRYF